MAAAARKDAQRASFHALKCLVNDHELMPKKAMMKATMRLIARYGVWMAALISPESAEFAGQSFEA